MVADSLGLPSIKLLSQWQYEYLFTQERAPLTDHRADSESRGQGEHWECWGLAVPDGQAS